MQSLELTSTVILSWLMQWLWPFVRIAGLVMTAPLIGTKSVPVRMRLALAFLLSLVIAPVASVTVNFDPVSAQGILVAIQQLLVGAGLGLTTRLVFLVMEVGGQIIAQQTGLGFAAMVDPQNGTQVPVFSQLYIIVGTLVFLALNGHLLLIEVLAHSFRTLPVSTSGLTRESAWQMTSWVSWLLAEAVLLALPAIVALMVVNLALAVVARAAPQLNIISVGFPFMILFGMFVVLLTLPAMDSFFRGLFDHALTLARSLTIQS